MSMSDDKTNENGVSRRQMLIGAGAVAAGAAVSSFAGWVEQAQAADGSTEKWPWPYVKLDPQETAEIAYKEWYRIFCGGAVISSVIGQLREKVGGPYKSFPIDGFVFLEGGQVGWGTICGSPAGANIVANMIIGPRIAGSAVGHHIAADNMDFYSKASMPVFVPKNPKIDPSKIVHTVSDSPLCHISVGKWMKESGLPLKSAERKDRCARVAASSAYRLVEMLNAWHDGTYEKTNDFSCSKENGITGQYNCDDCHGDNVPEAPGA